MLIPVEAGYGKATASYSYSPGTIVARDSFTGIVAASVLNARSPEAGAAWVTAGSATDFTGASSVFTVDRVGRDTATAGWRVAVLGSSMTDQFVNAKVVNISAVGDTAVVVRYTDTSNYLRFWGVVVGSTFALGCRAD
jgi:hypothetical protein